ncbi:MAG: SDR family oxidoreductase [Betaproteobacteria bacterium]|nr:SDR family oxidoreductase [Betaproteobacteria bacterium]
MGLLDSKVVIVTGAAGGLGRAMAGGLIAAGARVVGVDLPGGTGLDDLARELGSNFLPFAANICNEEECAAAVEHAVRKAGGLHVLVNNAGVGMQNINPRFASNPTRFWELTPAQWRGVIETNTTSQFLMARASAAHLIRQDWGRIINITTSFFTMHMVGFSPYGPSKAAAEANTVIMSRDLAKTGVTANVLIPGGPANTGMVTDDLMWPDRSKLVQPPQMIAPVVWLASDQSNGVTGRRFIAQLWDASLGTAAAATLAGAPAGW